MNDANRNLIARFGTAGLLIPFLILAINWKNPLAVWAMVTLAVGIGLNEWMTMTLKDDRVGRVFGVVVGIGCSLALYFWRGQAGVESYTTVVTAAVIATFLFFLFRPSAIETVAQRTAFVVAGALYVGLLTYLALLKARPAGDGAAWIYASLTIAWLSDTGAYFAGRFLGPTFPRKLYPSVSPKKTVVGSIGGLVASIGALVLAKIWYLPALGWVDVFAIAVPANVLGQLGDLAESLVKRSVGVKDSGALLPGHGGMLDRVDALLFVVPYVWAYASYRF